MWTDVLEGIDDRPFGAAVDAAVPGCTFVLPEEANEFDLFKKFFRVELMLLIVHETNEYARKQSAKNWAALMRVYRDTFTVVTPEKTLPAASQAMANLSTSDDLGCRAVTQNANRTTTPTWQQCTCSRANRRPEWAVTRDRVGLLSNPRIVFVTCLVAPMKTTDGCSP